MDAGQGLFERSKTSAFLRVVKSDVGVVKAVRPWYTGGKREEWHLSKVRTCALDSALPPAPGPALFRSERLARDCVALTDRPTAATI